MIEIYFSEDRGLLDHKVGLFRNKVENSVFLINPSLEKLEICLLQQSIEERENSNIILYFYNYLLFEKIETILKEIDLNGKHILCVICSKKKEISKELIDLISNKDLELKKLDNKTKRGFINEVVKVKKLKIKKDYLDIFKDSVPASASCINELLDNMDMLSRDKALDIDGVSCLLSTIKKEVNYFEFIYMYLKEDMNVGISFLNRYVVCKDTYNRFLSAFIGSLFELKKFIYMRTNEQDLNKISSALKLQMFLLKKFESIYIRHLDRLEDGINKFIVDIYYFCYSVTSSHFICTDLIKYFFIKNRI